MAGVLNWSGSGPWAPGGLLTPPNDRQAMGMGLLNAGAALAQGGNRGVLGNIGPALLGYASGYQGSLDRQRDHYLYGMKVAELEREQRRQEASARAAQDLFGVSGGSATMPEDPPANVRRIIDYHLSAGDPESAVKVYTDWATTKPDNSAPTVREFYHGNEIIQGQWVGGDAVDPDIGAPGWIKVGGGRRWAPQQPDNTLVEIFDPASPSGRRYVPRPQATNMPAPGSLDGGGPSNAQVANNEEIDAAWQSLRQYTPEQIKNANNMFLDEWQTVQNPNYDPYIERIARIATQRKIGVPDDEFRTRWQFVYGGGPAPASGPGSPTPGGSPMAGSGQSAPPRTFMGTDGDGNPLTGEFTGEYEGGAPVYLSADGRRFVVEQ